MEKDSNLRRHRQQIYSLSPLATRESIRERIYYIQRRKFLQDIFSVFLDILYARACLKNYSRNLHALLCGRFHPNSVAVARYGALIRAKSPTNCDAHLAESLFQTRSRKIYNPKFLRITFASSSAVPSIPKLLLFSIKSIYSELPGC